MKSSTHLHSLVSIYMHLNKKNSLILLNTFLLSLAFPQIHLFSPVIQRINLYELVHTYSYGHHVISLLAQRLIPYFTPQIRMKKCQKSNYSPISCSGSHKVINLPRHRHPQVGHSSAACLLRAWRQTAGCLPVL